LRQPSSVLYIAVDTLIPTRGKGITGFDDFTAAVEHARIPAVWLTSRSRLQFDEPRRRLGHVHPFIAEDGCGVFLPQDYFHLRSDSTSSRTPKTSALRLGRFTCIPIAKVLPAASAALEALSEDTRVPIVTLRSLSPRELAQNTGLPQREAELARQRDFDELFFFAGASPSQTNHFLAEGRKRGMEFRQHEILWSAAIGASTQRCIAALSRLYDRALRYHAHSVAIATADGAFGLFPCCDRSILLSDDQLEATEATTNGTPFGSHAREIPLRSPEVWEQVLAYVALGA
jgi:predicted mannosyl-3-phosphoglycerate phosphatase (HAD superfamily)